MGYSCITFVCSSDHLYDKLAFWSQNSLTTSTIGDTSLDGPDYL